MEKMTERKAVNLHRADSINLMLYTLLLICTVLTIWLFKHRRLRFVHETGLTLIYGLIVGLILKYTSNVSSFVQLNVEPTDKNIILDSPPDFVLMQVTQENHNNTVRYHFDGGSKQSEALIQQKATFDPEIFFNLILPPIIFNAGFSLKKKHFFRNIGSILMFAIFGTMVSCFITGFIMYGVMLISSLSFSLNDALFFGAIISATDPVTVLAIFNDLNVDVDLFAMVFGESALNDAVAIVLSSTIERFSASGQRVESFFDPSALISSMSECFIVFFGSLGVGILNGCAAALLTKFTRIADYPILETSLFILSSYLSFLMAEASGMTGVVAVLFCGICQAHYTFNNLSEESQKRTKQFFEILNFLAENFIFTYIGVSMFTSTSHGFNLLFIVAAFIAAFLARAVFIYPLSSLLNLCRRPKIPSSHQHMLLFAGLRGAVAFALAIRNTSTEERRVIYTTTSLIVIFTVLVNGGLTLQMIEWLKIKKGTDPESEVQSPNSGSESGSRKPPNSKKYNPWDKSFLPRKWYNFDSRFLKPLLTNSRPTLIETTPACCLPFAKLMTTTRQINEGLNANRGSDLSAELDQQNTTDSTVCMEETFAYQSFAPVSHNFGLMDGPSKSSPDRATLEITVADINDTKNTKKLRENESVILPI